MEPLAERPKSVAVRTEDERPVEADPMWTHKIVEWTRELSNRCDIL